MSTVRGILEKKATQVARVDRDHSVLAAARLMNQEQVGAVVVTVGDKVVGIFTERDVMGRVVAMQRDPAATRVGEVMTSPVACCTPDTTRSECRAVMSRHGIRHLPVVQDDCLVGMVSIRDILEVNEAEHEETIRYLHEYLYGAWPA